MTYFDHGETRCGGSDNVQLIGEALRDLQLLSDVQMPCRTSCHAVSKRAQFNPSSEYALPTLFLARDGGK